MFRGQADGGKFPLASIPAAVVEILIEYLRKHSDNRVQENGEQRLRQLTNLKVQRLIDVVGSFDHDWRRDLEIFLVDEYKDAVNSIVDLRNNNSHGHYVGVTMSRVQDYYSRIGAVVDHVADLCVPPPLRGQSCRCRTGVGAGVVGAGVGSHYLNFSAHQARAIDPTLPASHVICASDILAQEEVIAASSGRLILVSRPPR